MRAGAHPDLLAARAGPSPRGLAVDVAGAGGDLEQLAVDRPAVLAHEEDVPSSVTATTATAPGWRTMSRVNARPVGGGEAWPRRARSRHPSKRTSSRRTEPCGGTAVGSVSVRRRHRRRRRGR